MWTAQYRHSPDGAATLIDGSIKGELGEQRIAACGALHRVRARVIWKRARSRSVCCDKQKATGEPAMQVPRDSTSARAEQQHAPATVLTNRRPSPFSLAPPCVVPWLAARLGLVVEQR